MSEQLHLYACILRIHWLHIKTLCTDNSYLIERLALFFQKFLLEIASILLLCHDLFFIFAELTLYDFLYQIDRYIHIIADLL